MSWRNLLGWSLLALVALGLFAALSLGLGILNAACVIGAGCLLSGVVIWAVEMTMDNR